MSQATELKIHVISKLSTEQRVLLYRQDIPDNVKNFLPAAWEHPHIAPKAQYDVTLPLQIGGEFGCAKALVSAGCSAWHIAGDARRTGEVYVFGGDAVSVPPADLSFATVGGEHSFFAPGPYRCSLDDLISYRRGPGFVRGPACA